MNQKHNIVDHLSIVWKNKPDLRLWKEGPINELPNDFCVLEFGPTLERNMWTYASCGMSNGPKNIENIELFILSPFQDSKLVELIYVIAHYHLTGEHIGLNHTINFGRPWSEGSICEYGLISLPYLDGPYLENLELEQGYVIKFYWIIPISKNERDLAISRGVEKLEDAFETNDFNFLNPLRKSVV